MSINLRFNWIFKFGCLSMFSFIALGARYGHKGKLDEDGTALFHKGQLYHLANSISYILCRFWSVCFLSYFAYFYTFKNCNWRFCRWNFDLRMPTVLYGSQRQELVYIKNYANWWILYACKLAIFDICLILTKTIIQ